MIYRLDHEFLLDVVIGRVRQRDTSYDFVLASQPGARAWMLRPRSRMSWRADPEPGGRPPPDGPVMGRDTGAEIVERLWPGERPVTVDRALRAGRYLAVTQMSCTSTALRFTDEAFVVERHQSR